MICDHNWDYTTAGQYPYPWKAGEYVALVLHEPIPEEAWAAMREHPKVTFVIETSTPEKLAACLPGDWSREAAEHYGFKWIPGNSSYALDEDGEVVQLNTHGYPNVVLMGRAEKSDDLRTCDICTHYHHDKEQCGDPVFIETCSGQDQVVSRTHTQRLAASWLVLSKIPAAHKGLALTEPVDLREVAPCGECGGRGFDRTSSENYDPACDECLGYQKDGEAYPSSGISPALSWVTLTGGEQPMNPDDVRAMREQCREAGIPFWFEGWGKHVPIAHSSDLPCWAAATQPWTYPFDPHKAFVLSRGYPACRLYGITAVRERPETGGGR